MRVVQPEVSFFLKSNFLFSESYVRKYQERELKLVKCIPLIHNLTVLVEVFYAASFIPSVTNEWTKLPTVLLRETVTKAITRCVNIRLITIF